jgi:hypothetical protein
MTLITETNLRPDEEINKTIKEVTDAAAKLWNSDYDGWMPQTGFGIADLAPYHVSGGGTGWGSSEFWSASIAASNTWQDWMNHTQTELAYVIATGIFDLEANQQVTYLRPNLGVQSLPAMNIEALQSLDIARAWFEKPWNVAPKSNLTLRMKGLNLGTERIGLLGYAVAQVPYLILEQ